MNASQAERTPFQQTLVYGNWVALAEIRPQGLTIFERFPAEYQPVRSKSFNRDAEQRWALTSVPRPHIDAAHLCAAERGASHRSPLIEQHYAQAQSISQCELPADRLRQPQ